MTRLDTHLTLGAPVAVSTVRRGRRIVESFAPPSVQTLDDQRRERVLCWRPSTIQYSRQYLKMNRQCAQYTGEHLFLCNVIVSVVLRSIFDVYMLPKIVDCFDADKK